MPFANIILAIKEGTVDDVRYFIEQRGVDVNAKDSGTGMTLLHFAAGRSNFEILAYLISHGADVNINLKENKGFTPLHVATVMTPNVEVLEYLISKGADVNVKNYEGSTPLHSAAGNPDIEVLVLAYLISQYADVNMKGDKDGTPLHYAAQNSPNVEILKCLISKGADVNAKDNKGCTPLHYAISNNPNVEIMKYLISKGADVNAKDNDGDLLFVYAHTDEKKRILREAGARSGSSGSDPGGCGCLVFLVALGGLLTSGICGLMFAILGFMR